eukprot:TRINITY_DN19271_c0_g1_i1.p1 TRINITY_DN19271_c0_g1~~TRINITY_DN19271_c0_g1_i1.p1  ORF type:complete len:197 (-),score=19.55 TRINITY_DN19271_c0_g1_i1:67-657(-)
MEALGPSAVFHQRHADLMAALDSVGHRPAASVDPETDEPGASDSDTEPLELSRNPQPQPPQHPEAPNAKRPTAPGAAPASSEGVPPAFEWYGEGLVCASFSQTGKCATGPRCPYLHRLPDHMVHPDRYARYDLGISDDEEDEAQRQPQSSASQPSHPHVVSLQQAQQAWPAVTAAQASAAWSALEASDPMDSDSEL